MTPNLDIAIENLYKTFSVYPATPTVSGCSCCVSEWDKRKMISKPLRQIEEDDLSRYAFKALSTWGTVEDFKHFLPRIFELLSTTDFIVDTFVVLGNLDMEKWKTWSENEQTIITQFLLAWWEDSCLINSTFNTDNFIDITPLLTIEVLLANWTLEPTSNSFLIYLDLIENWYYDLTNHTTKFKELTAIEISKFIHWIRINSSSLESAFFYFDDRDKDMAQRVSTALSTFEHYDSTHETN